MESLCHLLATSTQEKKQCASNLDLYYIYQLKNEDPET